MPRAHEDERRARVCPFITQAIVIVLLALIVVGVEACKRETMLV